MPFIGSSRHWITPRLPVPCPRNHNKQQHLNVSEVGGATHSPSTRRCCLTASSVITGGGRWLFQNARTVKWKVVVRWRWGGTCNFTQQHLQPVHRGCRLWNMHEAKCASECFFCAYLWTLAKGVGGVGGVTAGRAAPAVTFVSLPPFVSCQTALILCDHNKRASSSTSSSSSRHRFKWPSINILEKRKRGGKINKQLIYLL